MEILLERLGGSLEKANIVLARNRALPGLNDGWCFNFQKHRRQQDIKVFCIVTISEPEVIQGCIALKFSPNDDVYMAYVEIAPHNRKPEKTYTNVAGCLIAFGCRESFKMQGHNKGFLAFNAVGINADETKRLILHYQKQYGATLVEDTHYLFIAPEQGEKLIGQFLKTQS